MLIAYLPYGNYSMKITATTKEYNKIKTHLLEAYLQTSNNSHITIQIYIL